MTERVTREQVLSVGCPRCGARKRARCILVSGRHAGWLHAQSPHRERRQAYLDKQAGEAREGRE